MKEKNNKQDAVKTKNKSSLFAWVFRIVLVVFVLLVLISLLIHVPFVQNKIVDITANQFSEKWNTKVDIESVDFSVFKGLQLNNFYVEDLEQDTLIFAENLNISLKSSLASLYSKKVDLSYISLDNSLIRIKNNLADGQSNLTQVFGNGNKHNDQNTNSNSFSIGLDQINLTNNRLDIIDVASKETISIKLEKGSIEFDKIDLINQDLSLNKLNIYKPTISIYQTSNSERDTLNQKEPSISLPKDSTNNKWKFKLAELSIKDGFFELYQDSFNMHKSEEEFDSKNFVLSNFTIELGDLIHHPDSISVLSIDNLQGTLNDKIKLKEFKSSAIELSNQSFKLTDLKIRTDKSALNQELTLSFNDFPKRVDDIWDMRSNIKISDSKISESELLYFVPSLKNAPVFKNNGIGYINIEGKISGTTKNIRGQNLSLSLGNHTYFKGDIFTRNLNKKDEELINVGIDQLSSTVGELRKIIPGFNPPENFNKLGNINFVGRVDGFFKDFVTFGHVKTDLGIAEVDLRLDVKQGIDLAEYSGDLRLDDFDLRKWSDNDDFGIVSLNVQIDEGIGLKQDNARAKLQGGLELFEFRGYQYRNADLTGLLDENKFNGSFSIRDQNVDLDFNGLFEFKEEIPSYKFNSNIRKLDLFAMNLSGEQWDFSGAIDIDMEGENIERAVGIVKLDSLKVFRDAKLYDFQNLEINSRSLANGMLFSLDSDFAKFNVSGKFDLREIPKVLINILKENYPYHTRNIAAAETTDLKDHNFSFNLDLIDSKNFLELAGIQDLSLVETEISGEVNGQKDQFDIDLSTPFFVFNKVAFVNLNATAKNLGTEGKLDIKADTFSYDSNVFEPLEISLQSDSDDISFLIKSEKNTSTENELSLKGKFIPHDRGYQVSIDDNQLTMLGENWEFNPKNKIIFGTKYLDIDDFDITDGHRQVSIRDIDNSGLDIKALNFNLDLANPTIDYDKMLFSGSSVIVAKIEHIFEKPKINARVDVNDFRINDDPWGTFNITASQQSESVVDINVLIQNEDEKFAVAGYYDLEKKYLESFIKVEQYPLDIFEYIIPDGISNTTGVANIEARINGQLDNLKLQGDGMITGGSTKVDYLGCTYDMDKQRITITDKFVDLTGVTLTDVNNNRAVINGGLTHDFFTDFLLKVDMSSDKFVILNTTKVDNPLYYGFGQGEMEVKFRGPFSSPDIDVDGVTGEETKISFPISTTQSGYDKSFIKFVSSTKKGEVEEEDFKLEGVDFEMNLEITEAAEMKLIFDEQVGEILEGTGRGNVSVYIKRNGEFDVYGDYDITDGEYLFTAYGLIAKPFKIEQGGSLRWSGDPFDASLDITANYSGVRAPLNVFLAEYLEAVPDNVRSEAKNRTDVNLQMLLGGTLYNPDINFDISFEDVSPALRSYTDSKMQLLRATDNGINNQVVGLLIFKTFLPVNNPLSSISGNSLLATGSNTLTEFFTSQLGLLLGDALQSQLGDDFFIQDIDVEIGLNENTSLFDEGTNSDILPDELDLNLRNTLKNNMVLSIGGNYVWENNFGNTNYLVGDFSIKYPLTKDRRLNVKLYGKLDYDEVLSRRKVKYGSGISYRLEFENLSKYDELQMQNNLNNSIKAPGSN